jgi:hypothetical protein
VAVGVRVATEVVLTFCNTEAERLGGGAGGLTWMMVIWRYIVGGVIFVLYARRELRLALEQARRGDEEEEE